MHWTLTQTVPPACEPVTVDDLKAQARIDADLTDEDGLLDAYIVAARQLVEEETGRQLLRCTYVLRLDRFPRRCRHLLLPRPPVAAVSDVSYLDEAGATQTWAPSQYVVDPYDEPGRLVLAPQSTWPVTQAQTPNTVAVTYTAGYDTDPAKIPGPLRIAILLMGAELYARREMTVDRRIITTELPLGVRRLLGPYRTAALLIGHPEEDGHYGQSDHYRNTSAAWL